MKTFMSKSLKISTSFRSLCFLYLNDDEMFSPNRHFMGNKYNIYEIFIALLHYLIIHFHSFIYLPTFIYLSIFIHL
jgi:hypothetical protein